MPETSARHRTRCLTSAITSALNRKRPSARSSPPRQCSSNASSACGSPIAQAQARYRSAVLICASASLVASGGTCCARCAANVAALSATDGHVARARCQIATSCALGACSM